MVDAQKLPSHSFGENGKITFEPTGSNWLVSASIRYGRASAMRHLHYETARHTVRPRYWATLFTGCVINEFGDGQGNIRESHLVLDFQAGKDVGLGLFGTKGNSVVSAGVRFAQFTSGSDVTLHALPTYVSSVTSTHSGEVLLAIIITFIPTRRSSNPSEASTAVGPTVSWDASLAGRGQSAKACRWHSTGV